MDYKDLAANLGFDEDDLIELVELFVTTSLSDIDKIRKSVLDSNPEGAAMASHSIKGAAGNLGFDEISGLARNMEMQAKKGSLDNFEALVAELEERVRSLNA